MRLSKLIKATSGLLLLALLSGCIPSDASVPPAPTATFVAPYATDEEALAAAEEAYAEYVRVSQEIHQEGLGNAAELSRISSGDHLAELLAEREKLQTTGQYILGEHTFNQVVLQRYSRDGSPKEMLAVYLCDDLSGLAIYKAAVKIGPSEPTAPTRMQVVFDYDSSSDSLLVSARDIWSDEPC